jgi:hypothetical protein
LGVVGLTWAAQRYFTWQAADDIESAMRTFSRRLDQRLFP